MRQRRAFFCGCQDRQGVCSVRLFWEEQPPFAFYAVRRGRHSFVPAAKSGRWMKIRGFLAPVAAAKSVSLTQQGNEGLMGLAITETGPQPNGTRPRRANRRLNGMAQTAGFSERPTRGRFTRTLALVDAALRVWEANQPRRTTVWRNNQR